MGQFVGSLPFAILMVLVLGGGTVAANLWYRGIENPFNGSRERTVEMQDNTLSDRLVDEESPPSGGRKSRRKNRKSKRNTLTKK